MTMFGIAAAAALLYGTLVLRERLSGQIIMLLISIFAAGMPVIHLRSPHINETARSAGGFFFFWTLLMLGVLGTLSLIMVLLEFWDLRRGRKPPPGDGGEN